MVRRTAIALVALVVAWGLVGCRRKPPPPPPTPPAPAPVVETPEQAAEAGKSAVVAYLTHLEKGEYEAAHALLTSESQAEHPYEEFAEQAKKSWPLYEKDGAAAKATDKERVVVSVPKVEDPARIPFVTAKDGGKWRVVYLTGRPWTPYPRDPEPSDPGQAGGERRGP